MNCATCGLPITPSQAWVPELDNQRAHGLVMDCIGGLKTANKALDERNDKLARECNERLKAQREMESQLETHLNESDCAFSWLEETTALEEKVASLQSQIASTKAQFDGYLKQSGGEIQPDGSITLSSSEWALWARRKGIERTEEAIAENERLKRGDFTPEEFQNLCHNLPEHCTPEAFRKGCEDYQAKLFGK